MRASCGDSGRFESASVVITLIDTCACAVRGMGHTCPGITDEWEFDVVHLMSMSFSRFK